MNRITFYFVALLSLVWFMISYFYISLEIYDLSQIPAWEYKILTFREKFLEYCLLIGMFIFWVYLGRNIISSDINNIKWRSRFSFKDNLTKIKWISSNIEEALNERWIKSFKDVSNITEAEIKELLNKSNIKYKNIYIETWSEQAKLAYLWKWKQLKEYKYFISEERNI